MQGTTVVEGYQGKYIDSLYNVYITIFKGGGGVVSASVSKSNGWLKSLGWTAHCHLAHLAFLPSQVKHSFLCMGIPLQCHH